MLSHILLAVALITPAVFWIYGKRLLGSQTHPAALFILAWMASALLLNSVDFLTSSSGVMALFWVLVSFGVLAFAGRLRRKSPGSSEGKDL